MIYGDDVSHVVTEEGVAYLYQAGSLEERRDALAAVAKATPIGTRITPRQAERLRRAGLVAYPADLGVDPTLADRSLLAARRVPGLVVRTAAERAGLPRGSARRVPALEPRVLGRLAAWALRAEAELTPKPGLVDRRGPGAHDDTDLAMFLRSAAALEPWFATLARAAAQAPGTPGAALRLRRDLGRIGRRAEAEMLAATGGVNTHRGALYSLGFLVAGAAYAGAVAPAEVARAAGELARRPDLAACRHRSHGDLVRDQYPGVGAAVHAATGSPGGAADVLATAMFLDRLDRYGRNGDTNADLEP